MFLKNTGKVLPKCKAAHSIRQSYLYLCKTCKNQNTNDLISTKYPLPYYYVKRGNNTSFYYSKNNIIVYYIHSARRQGLSVIPLYDYVKNNYEVILSDFKYDIWSHEEVCIVKAPNSQIYMIVKKPPIIKNISKGILLYDYNRELRNGMTYLFHSMPIANSFILVVMSDNNEMLIHVIDLIEEKVNVQKYSIRKIIETILFSLEHNNMHYEEINLIKNSDKLSFDVKAISSINNNITNLIFYDRYIVDVSLRFENNKKGIKRQFNGVLSIIATYQDRELTVNLQINKAIEVESYYSKNIELGIDTVLVSNRYKIDDQYHLSQSKLYSVIFSSGDYTIISEPNILSIRVVLYYKDSPSFIFLYPHLNIGNFGGILFISADNKRFVSVKKDVLARTDKLNKLYIRRFDSYFEIIELKAVTDLILNSIYQSDNTNWLTIEATDVVKQVRIGDILAKEISRDFNYGEHFISWFYLHYINKETRELYSLVYLSGSEMLGHRFYLFKSKVNCLLSKNNCFRLVWRFETNILKSEVPSVLFSQLKGDVLNTYGKILRLLSNKWNTGNGFIHLKVLGAYSKPNAYYDYSYNRKSITISPINTSIASTLHLVLRLKPILF
jgi:hypothetical protein